jgi:hypothetical protein
MWSPPRKDSLSDPSLDQHQFWTWYADDTKLSLLITVMYLANSENRVGIDDPSSDYSAEKAIVGL